MVVGCIGSSAKGQQKAEAVNQRMELKLTHGYLRHECEVISGALSGYDVINRG
jgi:hypothetical protein